MDLVQDIVQFQPDIETSSHSSISSERSENRETALTTFMESLGRSRSSSFSRDSEISDMENEIMQKSGISISKNNEMDSQNSERATTMFGTQETPKPEKPQAEYTSSGGQFVSGVEEDLNVAQDDILVGEEPADQEELDRLMEDQFAETLERREPPEEKPEEKPATSAEDAEAEKVEGAEPATEQTDEKAKDEQEGAAQAEEEPAAEAEEQVAAPEEAKQAAADPEEKKSEEVEAEAAPAEGTETQQEGE